MKTRPFDVVTIAAAVALSLSACATRAPAEPGSGAQEPPETEAVLIEAA